MTSAADDPESNAPDPLVGSVLSERYRLDARLGIGGMGAVYRARHLALHRDVAIKVLHAHLTEDPMVAKRFDREATAASKLDHPHCVQVLDTGTSEEGLRYLVMQLLDGRELRQVIDGPMPIDRAAGIGRQILLGLEHAHKRGLVHRDLKPENVFLVHDDEGRDIVKLVDFGIVKVISGDGSNEALTRAGMVFGTAGYMSPEQAAGGKIDERADLYAVGVLLYEMLTGSPPFPGGDLPTVLRMQLLSDPAPLPDSVPGGLRVVVMRLLQKVARDRFPTAREAREALEAAMSEPVTPAVETAAKSSRHSTLVGSSSAAADAEAISNSNRRGTWRGSRPTGDESSAASSSVVRHRPVVFLRAEELEERPDPPPRRTSPVLLVVLLVAVVGVGVAIAFALSGCASIVAQQGTE